MNYHHFTIEERCCLREYYVKGKSYREIARLLGRNVSSISREIMRNKTFMNAKPAYYPYTAQKKSNLRNSYRHRGMFWKQEVLDYIDEKLSQTWSPEQISKTPCGMKMPSFKTIYRWIDERYLRSTLKNLRRKGKTRKRLGNGGRFTTGKSIRKRDKSVYNRKEFGHWEADTVVSGQGKSKACFATLAERKTRYYRSCKDDHLRPRERVRLLERDRESAALRYVFRRSVLRMAKRDERKLERIAARVLPERQESFAGQSRDPEKEPGVDQRQAQESFAFPNTARFVPRKSHKVLHLV